MFSLAGIGCEEAAPTNEISVTESALLAEGTSSSAAVVRSVATLRTLTGTALPSSSNCNDGSGSSVSNCCIVVAGHTNHSDGGGGLFCYKPGAGAGVADNGGTVIKPNSVALASMGRWYRSFSGALNVAWFGANGADGDAAADDAIAISSALSALPTTGGEVRIAEGTFYLRSPVNVTNDNVRIVGAGRASILKVSASATGTTPPVAPLAGC